MPQKAPSSRRTGTPSLAANSETQQHINVSCTHPPLLEMRRTHRRPIDKFFQSYRHQRLTTRLYGTTPLVGLKGRRRRMEWSMDFGPTFLRNGYKNWLDWCTDYTTSTLKGLAPWTRIKRGQVKTRSGYCLLENTQDQNLANTICSMEYSISKANHPSRENATWHLQAIPPPQAGIDSSLSPSCRWLQYSSAKSMTSTLLTTPYRSNESSTRNDHRTSKWNLLICR